VKLQQDLREFVALLNSHSVEFLVVGGHAVAFHGHPRFTGDIDFLIRASDQNATRLLNALRAFGFGDKSGNVVQLGRPPNRIDLLTSISGVEFDDAWSSRVQAELDGLPVSFLGWQSLIENKQASGRPKDLADVAKLMAVAAARRPPG
jgi:hypothetical protein